MEHFTQHKEFEVMKYQYLKQLVDKNQRDINSYIDLFSFLYGYIQNENYDIMYLGLINECLMICSEIIKRFGKSGKKGLNIKEIFTHFKATLLMLQGQIADTFEILRQERKLEFNTGNFVYNLVNNCFYFHPKRYRCDILDGEQFENQVYDNAFIAFKANLLNILIKIDSSNSSKLIYDKFIQYYDTIIERINSEKSIGFSSSEMSNYISNKNYDMAVNDIESTLAKKQSMLFIPMNIDPKSYSKGIQYKADNFLNIDEIMTYWTPKLNLEKQKARIDLILSLVYNA